MPYMSMKDEQKALVNESNQEYKEAKLRKKAGLIIKGTNDFAIATGPALEKYRNIINEIFGEKRVIKAGHGINSDIEIENFNSLKEKVLKPHVGKPWKEVARDDNATDHFVMYAISKGVSIWDIDTLMKNPDSQEGLAIRAKLVELRDDYVRMVVGEDKVAMKEAMIGYMLSMKKELPKIYEKISSYESAKESIFALRAIGSIHAFFVQDYPKEGAEHEDIESSNFKKDLDQELKERGEGLSIDKIYFALIGPNLYTNKFNGSFLGEGADVVQENLGDIGTLALYVNEFRREFMKSVEKTDTLDKALDDFEKKYADVAEEARRLNWAYDAKWNEVNPEKIDSLVPELPFDPKEAETYLKELDSTKHKSIIGSDREDSDLYKAIRTNLTRYINAKKDGLNMDRSILEALKESCDKYLMARNPSSKDGKARFKLVNKIFNYATDGLEALGKPNREMHEQFIKENEKSALEANVDVRMDLFAADITKRLIENKIAEVTASKEKTVEEKNAETVALKEKIADPAEIARIKGTPELLSIATNEKFAKGPFDEKHLERVFIAYLDERAKRPSNVAPEQSDKEKVIDEISLQSKANQEHMKL